MKKNHESAHLQALAFLAEKFGSEAESTDPEAQLQKLREYIEQIDETSESSVGESFPPEVWSQILFYLQGSRAHVQEEIHLKHRQASGKRAKADEAKNGVELIDQAKQLDVDAAKQEIYTALITLCEALINQKELTRASAAVLKQMSTM